MKLSQLITKLQAILEKHGDITVVTNDDDALCEPLGRYEEPVVYSTTGYTFWDKANLPDDLPEPEKDDLIVIL
jgi:hypothetical protein